MRARILPALSVTAALLLAAGPAGASSTSSPALTDSHPCADAGFTCSTLTVPLDHRDHTPGTLKLQVAVSDNVDAPKGVLLLLTGGPGQPGVPFAARLARRVPEVARDYRLVMIDQRGTGRFGALDCPKLQAQVGSSDIATPSADAVGECAGLLGATAPLYSTDQVVADLDELRQALGVAKMVVDGVSYGTYTAEHYAIAHPGNVEKVVLDSVLPHHATAQTSLYLVGLRAEARVLRDACTAAPACGFDPADDLAWVVRHRSAADGVRIFDAIVTYEFYDPGYRDSKALDDGQGDVVSALHSARSGDPAHLDALLKDMAQGDQADPADFSTGLHAATLCADQRFPWGDASTPSWARQPSLTLTEQTLPPSATWPYTSAVAVDQGLIQTCLRWPAERPSTERAGRLPNVPVLLLNGDHDLSTPLEWARQEAATAPQGTLVVVKGASHSIQSRELGHAGRDAVLAFLG